MLESEAEPMVWPPTNPLLVNSVPAKVKVLPWILFWLSAVIVRAAGVMLAVVEPVVLVSA